MQDQAQPDREDRIAGDTLQPPEARMALADLGQPAEPAVGADDPALGVVQQTVEGGDWSRRGELASRVVISTTAGWPRPIVTIRYVGTR